MIGDGLVYPTENASSPKWIKSKHVTSKILSKRCVFDNYEEFVKGMHPALGQKHLCVYCKSLAASTLTI